MTAAPALEPAQAEARRRQAIRLEYFTIGWNLLEAVVALSAGWLAGSIALVGNLIRSGCGRKAGG